MKKIGIFYGSTTGNTQSAAEDIAAKLGNELCELIDVSGANASQLSDYEILILGASTWGVGDLQDDWEEFLPSLEGASLAGKKAAVFGTGDSASYPDSFCDAIGILAKAAASAGAEIIGKGVPASDYSFDDSQGKDGDTFVGLPLDYDNEDDKNEERINYWVGKIREEAGL